MVEDFNRNMMMLMLIMGVWITVDEAMSAYQPRTTKFDGLPNISFIKRKPKLLGTEGKTTCDYETSVMIHFEIQKGRDAMRLKGHAYMEWSHMNDKPVGSRMVFHSTVEGVGLMAIGYMYNNRRVSLFVATEGAGGVHDGEPYVQRWVDDLHNITTRLIHRPYAAVSQYFARSPRVDNHDQSHQHI
eukprot:jgi/Tetstr1/440982/TSEL_029250.t1